MSDTLNNDFDQWLKGFDETHPHARVSRVGWNDYTQPESERFTRFLQNSQEAGLTSDQTQEFARSNFRQEIAEHPGFERQFTEAGQQNQLDAARKRASTQDETGYSYTMRNLLPFVRTGFQFGQDIQYTRAKARFDAGNASQDDMRLIAQHERLNQIAAQRTTGQEVGHELARLPATVAEFAAASHALGPLGVGGAAPVTQAGAWAFRRPQGWRPEPCRLSVASRLPRPPCRACTLRPRLSGTSSRDARPMTCEGFRPPSQWA